MCSCVETTLASIVDAKPKFDRFLLNPIILLNLKQEKRATDKFSAAVIEKLTEAFKGAADTLNGGIETAFSMPMLLTAKH